MTARIAIVGNCQAQALEWLFSVASPGLRVDRTPPVFELTEDSREATLESLRAADVVLGQRIAADYRLPWLATAALRAELGDRLVTWPNLYFDGYFPGVRYIYLEAGCKLASPLEDYHLGQVLEAHQAGASAAEAAARLAEAGAAEDSFAVSFARLRAREAELDVPISDFLAEEVAHRRAFYTTNHPYTFVLVEMARRLAQRAGLPFDLAAADRFDYHLSRIYIPCFPGVARRHGLGFDRVQVYRGVEVEVAPGGEVRLGAPRSYLPGEVVESFYRIYDAALVPA